MWCVRAGYLPHSPYLLFVFLGRALHALLPAAVALSLLSLAGGLLALGALARWVRETAPCAAGSREACWRGATAAGLLAVTPIFVRHATTQEVYALQLGTVLLAAGVLTSRLHRRHAIGGGVFGCAAAVHSGSLFLAPALAFLVLSRLGSRGQRLRALAVFAGAAVLTVGVFAAVAGWLLPAPEGRRLPELLAYLRGLPPGLDVAPLGDPERALESAAGLLARLSGGDIPLGRGPQATGPTGLSALALGAAGLGWLALSLRNRTLALFWALWALPFAVYEIALGWNLDYGVYLVFAMPPLVVLGAEAVWWPAGRLVAAGRPRLAAGVAFAGIAALGLPALLQLSAQWGDPRIDRLRHDSAATLAARWAAASLPAEAVVVQPRSEWNANLLGLHASRRPVTRAGAGLRLLHDRGPWTPMRPDAYRPLTGEALRELIEVGVPVFAFEPDPLAGAPALPDPGPFVWERVATVDLHAVAVRTGALEPGRFEGRVLPVYRAKISRSTASSGSSARSR